MPSDIRDIERFSVRTYPPCLPFAPWLDASGLDLSAWWNTYFASERLSEPGPRPRPAFADESEAAQAILARIEKWQPLLDELRPLSQRPTCWFPIDRRMPWTMLGGQSQFMSGLMRVLRVRVSAELALNRVELAAQDMQFALRLADLGRQGPMPTSVAYALHTQTVTDIIEPLWRGLAEHRWTDAQIAGFQHQLGQLNLLRDYFIAVRADALAMTGFLESLIPTTPVEPSDDLARRPDFEPLKWIRLVYPKGWVLQNEAAIHRFHLETTSRHLDPVNLRVVAGPRAEPRGLFSSSDPFFPCYVTPKICQMAQEAAENFPFGQTVVDLAGVACALERYRLAQGQFPKTLDTIAPKFMASVPRDVVTGEPLRYRRTEGGFTLYAVGFNKADDGGKPCERRRDSHGRPYPELALGHNDWVWTQPSGTSRR